jgi:acyl-CoA thioester hydrolase
MKAIVSATAVASPQFYDLDPMNIVWHGNYPRFLELGRVAVMDKIGFGYEAMKKSGFSWPIVDLHMHYARPMRYGHSVEVSAGIVEWENRLKITYVIRDAETGAKTMRASSAQVAVDTETGVLQWVSPPVLLEKLAPYLP